ncbi:MAG: SusC/RagA family TonB-linked outer membrane protein [Paludibacter sp.]|nr:SusC/RagA family TonB-linked outer membrane protein [Paludibacter sp.]
MKKSVGTLSFLIYVCISILHPIAASASEPQKTDSIRTNDPTEKTISFEKYNGLVTSFEQLITGKVPGVQVISNNGSPTSGNSIRVRGGGSVSGNNDPLIVLDGMPLDTKGIQGNRYNFNSLINPNDIETITILKDAYQTSVYGTGSNGVILINTKKPQPGKLKINFSTTNALQTPSAHSKVLTAEQYRNFINTQGSTEQKALLGLESTDWDKVIYQTAFATDNHISISAEPIKNVPITASIGYLNQDGILKTDNTNRLTANLNVRPSFFNNYLQLGIHLMGTANNNRFADTEAISSAQKFNPTLAVFSKNSNYSGFNEPYNGFLLNPLGILKQRKNTSNVTRRLTDIDIRYRLHFLPDITASLHFGSDVSTGDGSEIKLGFITSYFEHHSRGYLNANLNYKKFIPVMKCSLLAVVGYESITNKDSVYSGFTNGDDLRGYSYTTHEGPNQTSSYGMIRLDFDSKYWLSGSLRREGSVIFGSDIRSIILPAYSIGYNLLGNENLRWNKAINYLQLIAGYGMTYQSGRISNNELGYYTGYSQYKQPTDIFYYGWETSKMYNLEIKFGLLKNRINTSVNYYISNTNISVPTMLIVTTSQSNIINTGNSSKHGIEFSVNATPISTKNLHWTINLNFDYTKTKWLDFGTSGNQSSELISLFEDRIKITQAGYQPKMFFVMKQIYDTSGKPLEGLYEDINGDAQINWSDQIRFHSYAPDMLFNFGTQINYKKWSAGCLFRASIGNYVYNAINAYNEHAADLNANIIFNKPSDYLHTGFKAVQSQSSYFVENASFLKLDNVTLGYNVGEIAKGVNLKVGATVQNVFTMTKYKGVDPEISNGIDYGLYPRPRVFSMTVNLDF